jgi:CDP-glucose 4,6-dehydratase
VEGVVNAALSWQGRRVFITGHTGFKGGWLAWWLHGMGARLSGYALPAPTQPSLFEVAGVRQAFEAHHEADVRDAATLLQAIRAAQPEVVFHLAAQPLVRASYRDPLETFSTNVMGTANLLDAARQCGSVRAVVVVTTDKCYREQEAAHRETDPLGGHDPYSASKACAELVTESFRAAYTLPARGLGLASARAGNVIGGGDWTPERLLPDLLQAIASGQAVRLRQPGAVRPWQHVLEPLAGYITLAQALLAEPARHSGAFNFGPDAAQAQPVSAIVSRLLAMAAAEGVVVQPAMIESSEDAPMLHEAPVLRLDASKAQQQLGWRGRLALDDALRLSWQWHHAWQRGQDMGAFTRRQIDDYRAQHAPTT